MAFTRKVFPAVLMVLSLGFAAACHKPKASPEVQQQAGHSPAAAASPWQMELKLAPPKPSMTKPMTFIVHITDEHGQPVNDAKVNGALKMKMMDMGITQVKFAPKGGGDYEGSLKSLDMSGPWNLAVEASAGSTQVKKDFDVIVFD